MMMNDISKCRNLLRQITDIDHPSDSSQSFIFSQPSIILNDIEVFAKKFKM